MRLALTSQSSDSGTNSTEADQVLGAIADTIAIELGRESTGEGAILLGGVRLSGRRLIRNEVAGYVQLCDPFTSRGAS